MKREIIFVLLVLGLVGCATQVDKILAGVKNQCHYEALYESVAQIVAAAAGGAVSGPGGAAAGGAVVSGVDAIVNKICESVLAAKAAGSTQTLVGPTCPQVNGICIQGHFSGDDE